MERLMALTGSDGTKLEMREISYSWRERRSFVPASSCVLSIFRKSAPELTFFRVVAVVGLVLIVGKVVLLEMELANRMRLAKKFDHNLNKSSIQFTFHWQLQIPSKRKCKVSNLSSHSNLRLLP